MHNIIAAMTCVAWGLVAVPAGAEPRCGDGVVDAGEQCDSPVSSEAKLSCPGAWGVCRVCDNTCRYRLVARARGRGACHHQTVLRWSDQARVELDAKGRMIRRGRRGEKVDAKVCRYDDEDNLTHYARNDRADPSWRVEFTRRRAPEEGPTVIVERVEKGAKTIRDCTLKHDAAGRLRSRGCTIAGYAHPSREGYVYDAKGRLTRYTTEGGEFYSMAYVYVYDAQGRMVTAEQTEVDGDRRFVHGYRYDDAGRVTAYRVVGPVRRGWSRRQNGTLNVRPAQERFGEDRRTTFTYDALGRLTGTAFDFAAQSPRPDKRESRYRYDAAGTLIEVASIPHTYDERRKRFIKGRAEVHRIRKTDRHGRILEDLTGGMVKHFRYNNTGRVVEQRTWWSAERYLSTRSPPVPDEVTTFTDNAMGNLSEVRTQRREGPAAIVRYRYDERGLVLARVEGREGGRRAAHHENRYNDAGLLIATRSWVAPLDASAPKENVAWARDSTIKPSFAGRLLKVSPVATVLPHCADGRRDPRCQLSDTVPTISAPVPGSGVFLLNPMNQRSAESRFWRAMPE